MKKLLLAVPLLTGVSWVGASYYSGTQTQGAYDRLLDQLNELKPFTLVNESYNTGFSQSLAITRVMDSAAPDARVLFRLQHQIDHSPVGVNDGNLRVGAATIRTTLVRDDHLPESLGEFMSGFVNSEPFLIDSLVSFDGKTDTRLQVSPYRMQKAGVELDFGGLDYSMSSAGNAVLGQGTLGDLQLRSEGGQMRLSPGVIKADLVRISQAIYSGSYGIDFESLAISSTDNRAMHTNLQSIGLFSDTQVSNGQMSSSMSMSVGAIDSILPLNAVSMETQWAQVSIEGWQRYIETISQRSATHVMGSRDPEAVKAILAAYGSLIGPGTGLDFRFMLNNDGGDAKVSFGVSVVEETHAAYPAEGLSSIRTVRDLLSVAVLEAHLDADAAVIDQSPLAMFMMAPAAQQYILADGVSYKADLNLSELILTINGNPLPVEMMLGDKLDMPLSAIMAL